MSVNRFFYSLVFIMMTAVSAFGIVPPLEREISLHLNHEKITVAFEKMHDLAQVNFSYPASLIYSLQPVSISIKNKTIREALSLLLPAHILVKQKNNYILLQKKPEVKEPVKKQISGYVYDQTTSKKVPNVTVYDKESLQSVTTNEYGYYEITVPAATESISVNKSEYRDTAVEVIKMDEKAMINFTIQPRTYLERLRDSLQIRERLSEVNALGKNLLHNFSGYINSLNVRDTLVRDFQVSVLPFIGTNHRMSGSVTNHFSINVFGGYARGLRGFEVGTLFNLEKENAKGFQAAGLFNIVGDTAKGTQVASLMNVTGHHSEGFQAAGLLNIDANTQYGAMVAGLMNISKKQVGFGAAGLMNSSGTLNGVHIAGLANVSDSAMGVEVAGLFNTSNHGKDLVQVASLFNINHNGSSYSQISTFYNRCSYLKGVQFAFFNVADSAKGIPIGLLSIVRKGVHQIEFSADEWFPVNMGFRTGVNKLYNVISGGLRSSNNSTLWHLTYGIGSSIPLTKHWNLDLIGTVAHVSQGQLYLAANDLYRAYVGFEYRPAKKFAVAFGPHLNYFVTDALQPEYNTTYRTIPPTTLWSSTSSYGFTRSVWVGAKLAIRLF